MFGNLPWKSRHMLVQDEENWRELLATAMQALRDTKEEQVMPVRMGWITGEKVPVSSRHFLTYRSETTSVADGTYWIRRVPYPLLMVRDWKKLPSSHESSDSGRRMSRTADDLGAAIRSQSEATLMRRPDGKNWAANEVVCHLRDIEEVHFVRFHTILANDNPTFVTILAWHDDNHLDQLRRALEGKA